jgi:RNA methyltransferase, TrmH family
MQTSSAFLATLPGLRYAPFMQITSSSNERIKHARRVREGREPELIFIEGLRLAEEAFNTGLTIEACFTVASEDARTLTLLSQLNDHDVPIYTTTAGILESLGDTVQTQGLILIAERPQLSPEAFFKRGGRLFLALDRVQDPGNMGTLLRTAEAAGADGVLALGGSADVFSPKVLRSSMGSAFRLPVLQNVTPEALMALKTQHQLTLVAAAGEADTSYTHYDWQQPTLLLLGNEGRGVSPDLLQHCDTRLRIPMANGVESLNVATAGAVMLFEAARQRERA